MVVTTIAVKEDTMEDLKAIRQELGTTSLDATIKALIRRQRKPRQSLFGTLKGSGVTFTRADLDRSHR